MFNKFMSFLIVASALAVACASASEQVHCGENEQLGNCGRICEGKCSNPDMSECAATSCQGSSCQCKPGMLRNEETDLCVQPSECPPKKCMDNEILAACGRTCEGTCKLPSRPEICSRIRCATQDCQCDLSRGYVRDSRTGKCVRNQDNKRCANQLKCPKNSEPRICGRTCESTCSRPEEIFCKLDITNCVIDCHCSRGFVRNEETGECVAREQCPVKQAE